MDNWNPTGFDPRQLGVATALKCFREADLDRCARDLLTAAHLSSWLHSDGRISYKEFERWYLMPSSLGRITEVRAARAALIAICQLP